MSTRSYTLHVDTEKEDNNRWKRCKNPDGTLNKSYFYQYRSKDDDVIRAIAIDTEKDNCVVFIAKVPDDFKIEKGEFNKGGNDFTVTINEEKNSITVKNKTSLKSPANFTIYIETDNQTMLLCDPQMYNKPE